MSRDFEAVEKVPKQFLRRDAEESDLIEYTTINDLTLGKDQVTPEISVKAAKATFSTGSLGSLKGGNYEVQGGSNWGHIFIWH